MLIDTNTHSHGVVFVTKGSPKRPHNYAHSHGNLRADPGTLNKWLIGNGGYDGGNDLEESVVPKIDPSRFVFFPTANNCATKFLMVYLQNFLAFRRHAQDQ